MKNRYLLSLDTSGGACTVCVYDRHAPSDREKILAHAYRPMPYGQAQHIMPMVQQGFAHTHIQKSDISAVCVCKGPGYFTGMRIGLSTAQGLALGLGVPIYSVSAPQAIAMQVFQCNTPPQDITVIMETKRTDFIVQAFSGLTPMSAIETVIRPQISSHRPIVGSGVKRYQQQFGISYCIPDITYPDALSIAQMIDYMLSSPHIAPDIYTGATPLYLRAPNVQTPKKRG